MTEIPCKNRNFIAEEVVETFRKSLVARFGGCGNSASLLSQDLEVAETPQVSCCRIWRLRKRPQVSCRRI